MGSGCPLLLPGSVGLPRRVLTTSAHFATFHCDLSQSTYLDASSPHTRATEPIPDSQFVSATPQCTPCLSRINNTDSQRCWQSHSAHFYVIAVAVLPTARPHGRRNSNSDPDTLSRPFRDPRPIHTSLFSSYRHCI